jgi:hypothetical protein
LWPKQKIVLDTHEAIAVGNRALLRQPLLTGPLTNSITDIEPCSWNGSMPNESP